MKRTIILLFLCTAAEGELGEHIFVPQRMPWRDAQSHCRQYYTDLSSVHSQSDLDRLLKASGVNISSGWIGLHRDPTNYTNWKWSGGGDVTFKNWGHRQPDNNNGNETVGQLVSNGKWNDNREITHLPFYCFSSKLVKVKMTWEEALEHCREKHTDLTSLMSVDDRVQFQKEIQKVNITERVWIGLRYLMDRWLWVNNNPLVYKAWVPGGALDRGCPRLKRCGAFTKKGVWENWDCQDKLHSICK